MTTYTVTIVGDEVEDGEAPWLYVVSAATEQAAMSDALDQYRIDQDGAPWRTATCQHGLPDSGNFNDLRPDADALVFFREHAGWSRMKDESDEEAKERSARELADAEEWAHNAGYSFGWAVDLHDDHTNGAVTYVCSMYADDGELLGSLAGVDLADKGTAHPYARVVQAEIASEHAPR